MRRVAVFLLGLFFVTSLCLAQIRQGSFTQRGIATQEMRAGGLSALHPTLPIGTRARITNVTNGKEIEVTITGRIPASAVRIIDLSSTSASLLGMGNRGDVIITASSEQRVIPVEPARVTPAEPVPVPAPVRVMPSLPVPKPDLPVIVEAVPGPDAKKPDLPQMSVVSVPEPELRSSPQPWPEMPPVHIIIYNYVVNPPPPDTPAFQFSEPPVPEPPVPQFCEPPPPEPPVFQFYEPPTFFPPMASRYPPLYDTPPASEVLIIPGLPSPNSYRLYHLQVGAYPNAEKASRALRQLQAAGFDAFQEMASADVYRVFAVGIPAAIVYDAVRRLGAMGFSQVWVWE